MIEYKAARAGRDLIVIDRWYPSSKHAQRAALLGSLSLSDATLDVPVLRHPARPGRERAQNILAAGLAVAQGDLGDACGADVSHSGSPGCSRP